MAVTPTCKKLLCEAEQIQKELKEYECKIPKKDINEQFAIAHSIPEKYHQELVKLQQKVESLFLSKETFNINDVDAIAQSSFGSRLSMHTISMIEKEIKAFDEFYDQTTQEAQQNTKTKLLSIRDTINTRIDQDKLENRNSGILGAYIELAAEIARVTSDEKYRIESGSRISTDSNVSVNNSYSREPSLDSKIKQLEEKEMEAYKLSISSSEFDAKFLLLFEELRILARNHPGLKERDASFFSLYSDVFNLLVSRQKDSEDISASFIEILERTKPR
jgi:hypothetical protein